MHVALFNSFFFHHEMFGFAIDYLLAHAIPFTIFTNQELHMGWYAYYTDLFGPLTIRPYEEYFSAAVDVVFLLTDDDFKFQLRPDVRAVMFEHKRSRMLMRHIRNRYTMRPFPRMIPPRSPDKWLIPLWSPQRPIKRNTGPIRIVSVGYNCPTTPADIAPYIKDVDVRFTFFDRNLIKGVIDEEAWASLATIHYEADAKTMIDAARYADWILLIPKQEYQIRDAISAMVPLAYSVGTPLLMYPYHKVTYPLEGIGSLDGPITRPSPELLAGFQAEQQRLIERRDRLLTAALAER